jgi:hypothetical protein
MPYHGTVELMGNTLFNIETEAVEAKEPIDPIR